ncbi:transmembrane protein 244 isoform X1 [Syngnathus acus]|uniref:transmembrane protein 244 isoform X1 n=1 Tax=Syngnathus acus TaxID=161584 RepID=UPI001885D2CD|nr:transmembrane protein 244 isoform X1 [Syngnathus acus]XP_037099898.1 transmembrane protein 244 isoform X1 [Syngnathus acus]
MFLDYCCRCCGFTLIKRHGAVSLKTTPSDTWVVLQNLLMCTLCFYSLYYVAVSLCVGLLRVHEINSLLAPFDYTTQPSWQNPKYLVGVISTEVTYVLGGLVFAWIVEEWVWDYAITVTLLHVAMTVAVMSDFPTTEHWWIALGEMLNVFRTPVLTLIKRSTAFLVSSTLTYSAGSGLVMMIFGGQALAYKLFRSNFVHPAELQNF